MDSHEMIDTRCNNEKLISVWLLRSRHRWNIWNASREGLLVIPHARVRETQKRVPKQFLAAHDLYRSST